MTPSLYYDRTQREYEYLHVRDGRRVRAHGTMEAMDKLGLQRSKRWMIVRVDFIKD